MNRTTHRAARFQQCLVKGKTTFGPAMLLSCALLGMTLTARAAETAAQPAEPGKPASKAAKRAKKQDAPVAQATPTAQAAPAQAAPAAPAAQPAPAAPAGPAPGTVSYSGLLDWYFGVNARAPRSAAGGPFASIVTPSGETIGVDNFGRTFDINDRDPSFSLGELNISRTPGKGFPLGVTATLTVGDTARIVHANEPGGTSSWQTIQQLYLTYTPHVLGRDVAIDFGAFVTPFGQEVIESSSNDEYSRGFLFQYAIPFYHAGLRFGFPVTNQLSFLGGIVNGWNNIADDNNGKSLFAQLSWKPNAKFTGVLSFMGGPEGTGAYGAGVPKNTGNIDTNLLEFLPTYQVNDKLKLAGEIDYGSASGDVLGAHVNGNWLGFAGYARYQWTPKLATALRLEQFEDMPGTTGTGLRTGIPGYTKLDEITLTLEYALLRGHLISRLEYRHDHANQPVFGAGAGGTALDQDTIYFSQVYKF